VVAWTLSDFDVTDADATRRAVAGARPDVVIHAAAYTAVDRAESEPAVAMAVNRDGTANVCRACADAGARLVYVSTDYVFDGTGNRPIPPDAAPMPLGAYARSKVEGEKATRGAKGHWLIARSGWMFGPGRRTFVSVMREAAEARRPVSVVNDLLGAPTSAGLVAEVLWGLVARGERDVWHVTPRGQASWFDVALEIFKTAEAPPSLVTPVSAAESGRPAARPAYSVLDSSRSEKALGVTFPEWRNDLRVFARTGRLPSLGLIPEASQ
jgi:dTDP-4-dehydrorhamnose reductase